MCIEPFKEELAWAVDNWLQIIIKYDSTYVIVGIDMEKMATKFFASQYTP